MQVRPVLDCSSATASNAVLQSTKEIALNLSATANTVKTVVS